MSDAHQKTQLPIGIPEERSNTNEEENGSSEIWSTRVQPAFSKRPPSDLLQKRISVMPTLAEEKQHVANVHGRGSRRARLLELLHSKPFQYTLMGLLLLDVVLLFIEMFLSAEFPNCYIIERDAISCCAECPVDYNNEAARFLAEVEHSAAAPGGECTVATNNHDAADAHFRYLAEEGGHDFICEAGVVSDCPAGCDDHKWATVHTIEEVLFWCTVGILSIFMLELIAMMICIGPSHFFCKFFYALDFFIVTVSLVLEIVFHLLANKWNIPLETIVGLIVLLRVWRFIRIGHALVEVTHEVSTEKYEAVIDYVHHLECTLADNGIALPESSENVRKIVDESLKHSHKSMGPGQKCKIGSEGC